MNRDNAGSHTYNIEDRANEDSKMDIKRSGSQPSTKGSAEYFTGSVRIDPLFHANDPARTVGSSVTFELCSLTAWRILVQSHLGPNYDCWELFDPDDTVFSYRFHLLDNYGSQK